MIELPSCPFVEKGCIRLAGFPSLHLIQAVVLLSVGMTGAETGFGEKMDERTYTIFKPASRYGQDSPLNPAQAYSPDNPFNPSNKFDSGNPVNPANRYAPNNSFNPVNQGNRGHSLNPANGYIPATLCLPLNQNPWDKR
ncbi:MAG: hypothetical protein MRJ67_16320 [Nitrospirales bacterium]|nr:hypothetical protein [Nitrospirales bacterium]